MALELSEADRIIVWERWMSQNETEIPGEISRTEALSIIVQLDLYYAQTNNLFDVFVFPPLVDPAALTLAQKALMTSLVMARRVEVGV